MKRRFHPFTEYSSVLCRVTCSIKNHGFIGICCSFGPDSLSGSRAKHSCGSSLTVTSIRSDKDLTYLETVMGTTDASLQQAAQYAMALDLCSQLTQVLDEKKVSDQIVEIFAILFAPRKTTLWVTAPDADTLMISRPVSPEIVPLPLLAKALPETFPGGFRLRIPYKKVTMGIVEVEGLSFPEHQDAYLSVALSVVDVCGLAIANARAHTLLERALSDLRSENAKSSRLSEELRVANEQLEVRVRERTAELEKAMLQLQEEIEHRIAAEAVVRNQLAEKTILLRELHHRVTNNLQLITSMLST
jgi:hypothetical protein